MRRFQLDWNGSFEIGSAATEGRFLLIMEALKCIVCGTRHWSTQPCPAMADEEMKPLIILAVIQARGDVA